MFRSMMFHVFVALATVAVLLGGVLLWIVRKAFFLVGGLALLMVIVGGLAWLVAGKGGGLVSHGAELMAAYFLVFALAQAVGAWLPKKLASWQQRWNAKYQEPDATFSVEQFGTQSPDEFWQSVNSQPGAGHVAEQIRADKAVFQADRAGHQ